MADDSKDDAPNPWREWSQDPRPWYEKEGYESEEAFWKGLRRDEEFWNPGLRSAARRRRGWRGRTLQGARHEAARVRARST